jgi:hypothetical protein
MSSVRAVAFALLALVAPYCAAQTYEFRFWPPDSSFSDPRVVTMDDGPCGPVATARVNRMPELSSTEPLEPERVVELGRKGQVVNRWRIPVDAQVIGVSGSRLIFEFNRSAFSVGTDGSIAKEKKQSASAASPVPSCKTAPYFGESAYAACWRHQDAATGKSRLLVYEGVCT